MKNLTKFRASIKDVTIGTGVSIVEPVNIYRCTLGDGVFIGPFVEIQQGVTIGDHTRIQSHSFICELVTIGINCFISHGVMFTNDLFKDGRTSEKADWKETKIGNNVLIGSGATILPVTVVDHVVIGAGSVVTKDISVAGTYAGNPARMIRPFY